MRRGGVSKKMLFVVSVRIALRGSIAAYESLTFARVAGRGLLLTTTTTTTTAAATATATTTTTTTTTLQFHNVEVRK